jgi:TolB-like protein
MKRAVLTLAVLVLAVTAFAQPKVAVLDADLQKGIDKSAAAAISEKLTERLVLSGRFVVLDRSNVEQVLREREFQLSGLVSDTEISEAGKYLGADFVVAIRVQRVDRTYMVTAKMIAVDTGIIARQSSAEGEGRASILLALAEEAGDGLAGIPRKPAASSARKLAPKPASYARPADAAAIGTRMYAGLGAGGQHLEDSVESETYDTIGFDLYGLVGLWKGLCAVGSLTYLDASAQGGGAALSLDAGLGYARPVGILLPWVALKAGYVFLDWSPYSSVLSDLQYSLDLGADLRLGRLLLGGRFQLSLSAFADSGSYGLTALENSFWFMAGWKL